YFIQAIEQAVGILDADDPRQTEVFGSLEKLRHAPGSLVGYADVADLAGLDLLGEYREGLLDRHALLALAPGVVALTEEVGAAIRPVQLVDVQVVGLQSIQAAVERLDDVLRIMASLAVADVRRLGLTWRTDDLAGKDDVLATTGLRQPAADEALRTAPGLATRGRRVHLGRIDQVDAVIQREIQLRMRIGLAVLMTPGHGAQADDADLNVGVAQRAVFHEGSLTQVD